MAINRQPAAKWNREVPGARWFKADLHLHTIDDRAGKFVNLPPDLDGDPDSPESLDRYAHIFLQKMIRRGIQVAGLTPHSPRAGSGPESSGVWKIIEKWNDGKDDDGIPFRENIFGVFPGFEPSFRVDQQQMNLLFLFDPEIGRERYLSAYDLVTGGMQHWHDGEIQFVDKSPKIAFEELKKFLVRPGQDGGDFFVLAPCIDNSYQLLEMPNAGYPAKITHGEIAGLELGEFESPDVALRHRSRFMERMNIGRNSFFQASNAYRLDEIGARYTWLKLSSPRIEGLRQAFLASDSRVLLGFEPCENGNFKTIRHPPDSMINKRPWLREVKISGGTSFFGGRKNGMVRKTRFPMSPDFTCIIGGSMTGKSTFLDGLRTLAGAPMPDDDAVRANVEARAQIFFAGIPEIEIDCPGQDPSASLGQTWNARFFSQNELQRLSQNSGAVQEILSKLVPSEIEKIDERARQLEFFDKRLKLLTETLAKLDERLADAEQAHRRAVDANNKLALFAEAGVDRLRKAGQERLKWESTRINAINVQSLTNQALALFEISGGFPELDESLFQKIGIGPDELALGTLWKEIAEKLREQIIDSEKLIGNASTVVNFLTRREASIRNEVERSLAKRGFDASQLEEFDALNRSASLLPNYEEALQEIREKLNSTEIEFAKIRKRRGETTKYQRQAFGRVIDSVQIALGGRVRVRRYDERDLAPVEKFLKGMRLPGITRWWNELEEERRPSSEKLVSFLEKESSDCFGMSDSVKESLVEKLTVSKFRELLALRCPDIYQLQMRLDDGSYRAIEKLSGGQRVGLLLTLLLETADERPLVIDQPEDELDNRTLFHTVLPALKKLRGRRQVIMATHNANIVVNGDADMVIQLEADAHQGRIVCAGAIEEPEVRNAILRTVDGGEDAFRLRLKKYGF